MERDPEGAAVSLTGYLTRPMGDFADEMGLFVNANLVAGKRVKDANGTDAFGFHCAIGYLGNSNEDEAWNPQTGNYEKTSDWKGSFDFGFGVEAVMTPHAKFLAEYISAALAADIAGVRPITDADLGSFVLWPLLVVSYRI